MPLALPHRLFHRSFRRLALPSLIGLSLLAFLFAWTQIRPVELYLSDLRAEVALNVGSDQGRGNLLGIEPRLYPGDYQSAGRLYLKLQGHLREAHRNGLLNDKTVVVFPEHIGTWLVAANAKPHVYSADTLLAATHWLIASRPFDYIEALWSSQAIDRSKAAVFKMHAQYMAENYQQVFASLASEFNVTVVAGSILLPNPSLVDGQLLPGDGPLYNVTLTFDREGRPLGLPQRKVFPIDSELDFTEPGQASQFGVLQTPAGRLGVLLGADSLQESNYAPLALGSSQLLVVPAFLRGTGQWHALWEGLDGSLPGDDTPEPGELTEEQAWHQLALGGQIGKSGAVAGMTVFSRGQLWDLDTDGRSFIALPGQPVQGVDDGKIAKLLNLWL
ncbi:carbon-nitrogen hydrolase family protein [Atopomonas sediminilitoris]|uniref:carbon-nitrogen hydrolase family protein n=1 Tax=Atopomonas sediminilitoris TaxID=2919919 RepID=UPI001F4E9AB9|nr:carbon-nitrogen hydrolase family protein [Atopomonas sediminilitoris]MCJ8170801.1 carbon-nitrogen hydrolase family protein [Atopomonas sediminilitoris]